MLYKSSIATYYPFNSDDLQLIGGLSFKSDNNAGTTVFSVVSNTEKVGYIELSLDEKFQRKEINKGERVTFIFPYSEQIDFLNPTAFDEEGNALYYFGYPKGETVLKHEDFRWHKIEDDNSGG
ncbi:hypothetical protein FIU87_13165 [Bacillus sp. THAF10]|uniref:hypothetical protein n=1 Tax=Bacillus sp. THAF10 TaxID=2587848 RepID=UPI0012694AEB|nr:hypothetical protein [Bacillus sp. THAF10]QFT89604.1 hypothetical protein FIU87_13165 [Bacillus sp. THAF10]